MFCLTALQAVVALVSDVSELSHTALVEKAAHDHVGGPMEEFVKLLDVAAWLRSPSL
jgi:hypothetical protein